jgi:hypothetical protein
MTNKNSETRPGELELLLIIGFCLRRDLLPVTGAFLHLGIVTFRFPTVIPMICLRCGSRLGSVLFFFNIYDARLSGPETSGRISIIRRWRIAESAKAESRAEPKRRPSINNMGMTTCSVMMVTPMAMSVGAPVLIPVLSLMTILFATIIFRAVVVAAFVPRLVPSAIKPAITPVKSDCRSPRNQPEQGDDQA